MAKNTNLNKAKDAKDNEFYTRREDIEAELSHYQNHFKDKVVYCNCDDPTWSEFWRFFVRVFKDWGLKKLMATHYERDEKNYAYKLEICEDTNGDGRIDYQDEPTITQIPCNGDFRNQICIDMLKEADIVVTNPPFSLIREYILQLIEYEKKFLIMAPMTVVKDKEIFPLVFNNKIWAGYGFNKTMIYKTPYRNTVESNRKYVIAHGYNPDEGWIKKPGVIWLTNLDIEKRHNYLDLRGNYYSSGKYTKYHNLDAIDVKEFANIPCDYDGIMGVPISFLRDFNPDQFELIGCSDVAGSIPGLQILGQEWIDKYRAEGGTGHYTANMRSVALSEPKHKIVFSRIMIKNKHPEPRRYPDED